MIDEYEKHQTGLTGPVVSAKPITPSNTEDLEYATRAIYVGESGNVSMVLVSGDAITLRNLQAGVIYPLRVKRVRESATTAGRLVALR